MTDEIDDLTVDDVLDAPLDGRRVIVTRPKEQAGKLSSLLIRLGADVIHLPVIEIADPPSWDEIDWSIKKLVEGYYSWVVFSSTNAVDKFFENLASVRWAPLFLAVLFLVHPLLGLIGALSMLLLFGLTLAADRLTEDALAKSGAASDLFSLFNRLTRVIPGRLAVATVISNAVFAFVTRSIHSALPRK